MYRNIKSLLTKYNLYNINGENLMKITLPNGDVKEYAEGTSGMEIAQSISQGLAREAVGILVNGKQYDLSRPISEDAAINILTFDSLEGKNIFWHSSASC